MGYVKFFSYLCCFILFSLFFLDNSAQAAAAPGPDGGGYYTGRTDYDWVELSRTGTAVNLSDDNVSDPVAFPAACPSAGGACPRSAGVATAGCADLSLSLIHI